MIDGLPVEVWTPLGVLCVVLATPYLALARGLIVPRRTLEDAIHDRDEWRAESRIKDAQIAEKDEQLRHLAEVGRIVESLVRALPRPTSNLPGGKSEESP